MIEEAHVVRHEGHEPNIIADFLDADVLSGKQLVETDLAPAQADATAAGDGDRTVVERVLEPLRPR